MAVVVIVYLFTNFILYYAFKFIYIYFLCYIAFIISLFYKQLRTKNLY